MLVFIATLRWLKSLTVPKLKILKSLGRFNQQIQYVFSVQVMVKPLCHYLTGIHGVLC